MSRGIRDLRDLICVSRLTIRDSDEEIPFSDDDDDFSEYGASDRSLSSGIDSRHSSAQSLRRGHSREPLDTDSRESSARSLRGLYSRDVASPDTGIDSNGKPSSPTDPDSHHTPIPPSVRPKPPSQPVVGGMRRKKKRTKALDTVPRRHDLPKPSPLPPVTQTAFDSRPSSSSSESSRYDVCVPEGQSNMAAQGKPGNFDDMLTYLDATVISEWLALANGNVADIASWCHTSDNFVQFAHFWLSNFSDLQKQEILKMEYTIILEQLGFAFQAGRSAGKVKQKDLNRYLDAVFREYPGRLFSSKGSHLFLDHLDILSSERRSRYKTMLSDVKVSTRIKQHAQWSLAIRSFALVSMWSAIVNFYRRLVPAGATRGSQVPVPLSQINAKDPTMLRVQQSIQNGFVDVLHYFISTQKVSATYKDNHQRSLVLSAVTYSQAKVLQYLLTQTEASQEVNEPADSGNTPLHAAANSGNLACVKVLLACGDICANSTNPQCDNSTPLHLATLHGHTEVVECLLLSGADITLTMGDMTVESIATDFNHDGILELLNKTQS